MNDAQPLYVILACMTAGAAAGILYEGNCLLRFFFRKRAVAIAADALFFVLFACVYAAASALFGLPAFRLYMGAAALVGFLLYLESLHKILAFFAKMLYTVLRRGHKKCMACIQKWTKARKSASRSA